MDKKIYNKIESDFNPKQYEKEILKFWNKENIFKKCISKNKNKKKFVFFDGPPTANGKPHIGHVLTRAMKDIIIRYKFMCGYDVYTKAGWDTHGLPVELESEKELGLDGKEQIEKYGIDNFIKKCRDSVFRYKNEWEEMSKKIGYMVDFEHPYITCDNNYIESVWWAIKYLYDNDLLYKGYKIVPYCPRCGTALSSHEVAQGYKEVKEISAILKFKSSLGIFLAWTTTPWTLPSNVALCVNPKVEYAIIEVDNDKYILAKDLVAKYFENQNYKLIELKKGNDLENLKYEPLFPNEEIRKSGYIVTCGDFVTTQDGTGIVHIAPAFGQDDEMIGKKYKLPFLQLVDNKGNMLLDICKGKFCKDADKIILEDLKNRNLLFSTFSFKHNYPFCWRCNKPLIYYARSSWFVKVSSKKQQLLRNNQNINWIPDNIKQGRMGNFLENVVDWSISRERYWGTPLPIWVCDCGEIIVIGSRKELKKLSNVDIDDIHRPIVDKIELKCKCGKKMKRVKEVLDCWFDSGSMPYAQLHYPFENKNDFQNNFPADYVCEAVDQTRGWFYTMLVLSTILFNKIPFKNCIVLGHVNDKNGIKMSKSKGNSVLASVALDEYGADSLRWYFYSSSMAWLNVKYSNTAIGEVQRKFFRTYWNVYFFYVLYANIDNFNPYNYKIDFKDLNIFDKWIVSSVNSLIKNIKNLINSYKINQAARELEIFMENLSNWYIRRNRERFWVSGMLDDKIKAFYTLYYVLETFIKLSAPFVPFISDDIYQNIVRSINNKAPISVHLSEYPCEDENLINNKLNHNMGLAIRICELGRKIRNTNNIKNRQPLGEALVVTNDNIEEYYLDIIKEELNVKKISITKDVTKYVKILIKPELKAIGKTYPQLVNAIKEYLQENSEKIYYVLMKDEEYKCNFGSQEVIFNKNNTLITFLKKDDFAAESDGNLNVILDTKLNEDLINEGYVRELINKIQALRKESNYEVTDRIIVKLDNDNLKLKIKNYLPDICSKVLATKIEFQKNKGIIKEVNDLKVCIELEKVNAK